MTEFNQESINIFVRAVQSCNLNCTHCFTMGDRDPVKILDQLDLFKFVSSISKNVRPKNTKIYLHGGEPFLASEKELTEIANICKNTFRNSVMTIQSNLAFPLKDWHLDFMKKYCNSFIATSWDADIRFRSQKQEELFFKNLKILESHGIKYAVHLTVQDKLLARNPIEVVKLFPNAELLEFEHMTVFDDRTRSIAPNNREWDEWYLEVVKYYVNNKPKWELPLLQMFQQNINAHDVFGCKCNCCADASFTINADGTTGLCGDTTYWNPLSDVDEMTYDWKSFEDKALDEIIRRRGYEPHEMCYSCDLFEYCGGNIEHETFDDSGECVMGRSAMRYQLENQELFKELV